MLLGSQPHIPGLGPPADAVRGRERGATGRWRCAYGPPPALCSEQVRHPAGLPLGEPTREAQPRPATQAAAGGDRPPRSLPGRECSEEQRTPWLPNQLGPLPPRQAGCSSPRAPPQTDAALRGHQAAAVSLGGAGELAASTVTGHTCPRVPRRSRWHRSPAQCTAGHGRSTQDPLCGAEAGERTSGPGGNGSGRGPPSPTRGDTWLWETLVLCFFSRTNFSKIHYKGLCQGMLVTGQQRWLYKGPTCPQERGWLPPRLRAPSPGLGPPCSTLPSAPSQRLVLGAGLTSLWLRGAPTCHSHMLIAS